MKLLKKVSLFLIFLLITSILQQTNPIKFNNISSIDIDPPIRASVLISDFNIYITSLIIDNIDTIAIGAIKALQENGYNIDTQNVHVIGFDGRKEAQDLIQKVVMTGTVLVNPYDVAKDVYFIVMNLIYNKSLIENTNCTIDYTQKLITIPYGA